MIYYVVTFKDKEGNWKPYKKPGPYDLYSNEVEVEDGQDNWTVVKQKLNEMLGYVPTNINFYKSSRNFPKNEGFKHKYKVRFTCEKRGKICEDWEIDHYKYCCGYTVCENSIPRAYLKAEKELKKALGDTVKIIKITQTRENDDGNV